MLIKVKVFPGVKKEQVIKKSQDAFEIRVREKPEKGRANERVKQLLAGYLNLSEKKVRLIKGAKKRNKLFEVAPR